MILAPRRLISSISDQGVPKMRFLSFQLQFFAPGLPAVLYWLPHTLKWLIRSESAAENDAEFKPKTHRRAI